jgi:hypothetical protein
MKTQPIPDTLFIKKILFWKNIRQDLYRLSIATIDGKDKPIKSSTKKDANSQPLPPKRQ